MNSLKRAAILVMACLFGVGGCKRNEPVPPPNVVINPNPVNGYKVLLTIPDPPGKLRVTAQVTYAIHNNRDCVPLDRTLALGGIHPLFHRTVELPVVAVSETNYELAYFDDFFQSEDYYGEGPCSWIGAPSINIQAGRELVNAAVQVKEEMLGVSVTKMCPMRSTWPNNVCVRVEYAKKDLNKYFPIEILPTRS